MEHAHLRNRSMDREVQAAKRRCRPRLRRVAGRLRLHPGPGALRPTNVGRECASGSPSVRGSRRRMRSSKSVVGETSSRGPLGEPSFDRLVAPPRPSTKRQRPNGWTPWATTRRGAPKMVGQLRSAAYYWQPTIGRLLLASDYWPMTDSTCNPASSNLARSFAYTWDPAWRTAGPRPVAGGQ